MQKFCEGRQMFCDRMQRLRRRRKSIFPPVFFSDPLSFGGSVKICLEYLGPPLYIAAMNMQILGFIINLSVMCRLTRLHWFLIHGVLLVAFFGWMWCCWTKRFDLKETSAAADDAPIHSRKRLTQSGPDWQQVITTVYRKHFMTGKNLICTLLQIVVRKNCGYARCGCFPSPSCLVIILADINCLCHSMAAKVSWSMTHNALCVNWLIVNLFLLLIIQMAVWVASNLHAFFSLMPFWINENSVPCSRATSVILVNKGIYYLLFPASVLLSSVNQSDWYPRSCSRETFL